MAARAGRRPALVLASAREDGWEAETGEDTGPEPGPDDELADVKRYVEEHLADSFRVSDLSRLVELTRPHFTRVFTEREGMPPWRYVQTRRVRRATELLDEGMPLSDVAYESGFSDQSHLTRVFRRETGTTPGEYRKGIDAEERTDGGKRTNVQDGEPDSD